ncbi:deoxyribonuclease V [Glacieibacterium frigidum]|uniref:Endonuclease V n=1 Tax=Glacieibacterium frigidum TaxID=2593303 RepID=A0A552UAS9_9SPHN|nr:deoxyribonuclease V [Glacieibacterium frigidum]
MSIDAATDLQKRLAARVVRTDEFGTVRRVTGVDVAYSTVDDRVTCAAVTLDADTLTVTEIATATGVADFPYIPGLFSFRELPIVLEAFDRLSVRPDLVVCDGQGVAHPRRFGLASHLGVVRDIPTIGCAKTCLTGDFVMPADERGAYAPLIDADEIVGSALRTQPRVKPVFVSTGHRIALATAREWTLRLTPRFRLPETTRAADHAVRVAMKALTG